MKNALLNWKNILIGTAIVVVIACVAIIPYFVISDSAVWPISYISYVFLFSGVVVFFIGFVIQDIYRARLRHKTKNWNNPLPKDKISKAWNISAPFFLSGITSVVVGSICSIFLR